MARTMLVTGASKGIGYATAERFLTSVEDVTTLILLARESEAFTQALARLEELNTTGKTIAAHYIDLADRAEIMRLMQKIRQKYENIDILVNNAGYTRPMPLQQVAFADFERTMAVNVYAPFTIVQELLREGNRFEVIVNIASTAGIRGRSGWLTYSASKAAVINMSQVMREELSIYGTRVVCISPGRCATDLRRTLAPDEDPSTIMQPEHVAWAIDMLTSPVGRYVDSENLVVRQ